MYLYQRFVRYCIKLLLLLQLVFFVVMQQGTWRLPNVLNTWHAEHGGSWYRNLNLFVSCCLKCAAYHGGTLQTWQSASNGTWGSWRNMVYGSHRPTSNVQKYLFTVLYPFSKFCIIMPIRYKKAVAVAQMLVDHVFRRWGHCFKVLSDQGKEFESDRLSCWRLWV
jgi:hypothetical protein